MIKMERTCPLCDNENVNELFELNYTFPKHYNAPSDKKVVSCKSCGFVFNRDASNYDYLEDYSEQSNRYAGVDAAFYGNAYDYILQNIKKDAYILDVGCGRGFLLKKLKNLEEGYKNLYGLDPSEHAINELNQAGINGKKGSVYDLIPEYADKFDVIVFTNVIEHIKSPSLAVKNISGWLKADGILYIEAPNAANYHLNDDNLSNLYCAEHINHFSKYHINTLMHKAGFIDIFDKCDLDLCVLKTAYRKTKNANFTEFSYMNGAEESCLKSFGRMQEQKREAEAAIKKIGFDSDIAVYGLSHQFMFMYKDVFAKTNLKLIVDTDITKQGLEINGVKVCSPEALRDFKGLVLILSNSSKQSILNYIKHKGFANELICV